MNVELHEAGESPDAARLLTAEFATFEGGRDEVEPSTLSVLTRLREMLLSGELEPGEKLRSEALSHRLGLSRTPIRSALAILASQGLVLYEGNRGYRARNFELGDILASIEARALLEGLACRLCTQGEHRAAVVGVLQDINARTREIIRQDWSENNEGRWYALYYHFHRSIVHAAGDHSLRGAIRATITLPTTGDPLRTSPFVTPHVRPELRTFPQELPDHIREVQLQHEALAGLISGGSSHRAESAMREHVVRLKDRIEAATSNE